MVRYLDLHKGPLNEKERDKLLFWFVQAGMWGRFSGSTETYIDQDLAALEGPEGGLDRLLEQIRLWHGGLHVEPGHFTGAGLGARFYLVLSLLTRMGESRDWGTGLPLKASQLGKMSQLEVHHIFPKAQLNKLGYARAEVNALANFCFLTKDTNLKISDTLPEVYFPKIEEQHPGALASPWIPADPELWKVGNYRAFLEARMAMLAAETNHRLEEFLYAERIGLPLCAVDAGSGVAPRLARLNPPLIRLQRPQVGETKVVARGRPDEPMRRRVAVGSLRALHHSSRHVWQQVVTCQGPGRCSRRTVVGGGGSSSDTSE